MKFLRNLLGFIGIVLIAIGWASWKFDFGLPVVFQGPKQASAYMLFGALLVALMIFARIVGFFMVIGTILPAGNLVIQLVFVKQATWASIDGWNQLGLILGLLVGGFVLLLIGRGDDPFIFPRSSGGNGGGDPVERIADAVERIEDRSRYN